MVISVMVGDLPNLFVVLDNGTNGFASGISIAGVIVIVKPCLGDLGVDAVLLTARELVHDRVCVSKIATKCIGLNQAEAGQTLKQDQLVGWSNAVNAARLQSWINGRNI